MRRKEGKEKKMEKKKRKNKHRKKISLFSSRKSKNLPLISDRDNTAGHLYLRGERETDSQTDTHTDLDNNDLCLKQSSERTYVPQMLGHEVFSLMRYHTHRSGTSGQRPVAREE